MTKNKTNHRPASRKSAGATMLILGGLLWAMPAQAQMSEDISVSANVAFVSDYRFRGASASNDDPTVQLNAEVGYQGFSAGVWGSGIGAGAGAEVDLYGFYGTDIGPVSVYGGVFGYMYFGKGLEKKFEDLASMDLLAGASYSPMSNISVGVDLAYAPIETSFYISGNASITLIDSLALNGNIGGYVTDTAFWGNKTLDYGVSLSYSIGNFDLGLGWYANNGGADVGAEHNGNVVFSIAINS